MDALFAGLIDDAAVFPPGNASVPEAVRRHREHRSAWYAPLIGPLVVPDTELAQVSRAAIDSRRRSRGRALAVSVVISSGAGGLVALARRDLPGLEIVAAEIALRDLDDLAGNAGRVVAAAEELDPDEVSVFVEVPFGHGWIGAVEVIEAASLFGKIRTGGLEPDAFPTADQLAQQLSVLIEADLPFKATAGLHRAWPNRVTDERGADPAPARLPHRADGHRGVDRRRRHRRGRRPAAAGRPRPDLHRAAGLGRARRGPGAPPVPQLRLLRGHRARRRPGRPGSARGSAEAR